jgi:hypothetical protein
MTTGTRSLRTWPRVATGDETIRDIAGHVSKQMLKHYSHIRMDAKRRAVESLVSKESPKVASLETPEFPGTFCWSHPRSPKVELIN